MVASANVLILWAKNLPSDTDHRYLRMLMEKIRSGSSALVLINLNRLDKINPIIAHFEMTATELRIENIVRNDRPPRLVSFGRDEKCFRHMELFAGVDKVLVQQPNVIWYSGQAMPLLSASDNEIVVSDQDTLTTWEARECSCVTGWCGERGQVVIAVSGNLIGNPYRGPMGNYWPGIEANERFARNLLSYLKKSCQSHGPEDILDGNNLCDRIEENLADFVKGVLQKASTEGDWWTEFVPKKIRIKCVERKEDEDNKYKQREAYLDLIDLKTIIEKHWTLFERFFRMAGRKDKKNAIGWIEEMNEYRRMAAHPIKRHITGFAYSQNDLAFLNRHMKLSAELRQIVENVNDKSG